MRMKAKQEFTNLILASAERQPDAGIGEFLQTQEEIRQRLGGQAGLLDVCLEVLLAAVDRMEGPKAGAKGFEAGVSLEQTVRFLVKSGDDILEAQPFLMAALRFMRKHPLPYLDAAQKSAVYYIAMADAWGALKLREFEKELRDKFQGGEIVSSGAEKLYADMCGILGGNALPDRLVASFLARQCVVSPLEQYAQGLACHLNGEMARRVHEDGDTSLRLWLDRGIGTMPPLVEKPKPAASPRSDPENAPDVQRGGEGQHQAKK